MLIESLVKATVVLQGFRVLEVQADSGDLVAQLDVDARFAPRCGRCGQRARYRDRRELRLFRYVPLWGLRVWLAYGAAPGALRGVPHLRSMARRPTHQSPGACNRVLCQTAPT